MAAVSRLFEEIDRRDTPIGEISVRRRLEPTLQIDVYEVKLGEEHLMSSIFTVAEEELARLGLAAVGADVGPDGLDVVVGGLGLGYTARAALEDERVRSLHVVEKLAAVIEWQQEGVFPDADLLTGDVRTRLVEADFFACVADGSPFSAGEPERFHAVLLDVDHTPRHVLHPSHAAFYEPAGLARMAERIHPGGVFALWSDDPPDEAFVATAQQVFATVDAHEVWFPNFHTGGDAMNTVYVATV
jgi:spermidine synthase